MKYRNGAGVSTAAALKTHAPASAIAWVSLWVTLAPSPAAGQSAWPGYPNSTAITVTSSGNVGIGTATPNRRLHFVSNADGIDGGIRVSSSDFSTSNAYLILNKNAGTGTAAILQSGDAAYFAPLALNPVGGNVGIGTANPLYRLSVNGTIGAKEVVVTTTGWSDYVFRPNYRLRPLSEVKSFIEANHHLPDIPSETEVKEKGVSLGDMQSKLLAKIEELTLHMIQAEERNDRLEQQNESLRDESRRLKDENRDIRERLSNLESVATMFRGSQRPVQPLSQGRHATDRREP